MKRLLVILTLICGLVFVAQAQTDSTVKDSTLYLVTKTDGGEFYGYILKDDGREILLETKTIGKIYISKADIASITKVTDQEILKGGGPSYSDYRVTGPFTTRYAFTTNGLPIEQGENYALIQLYGPEVHFALTDNFSLGIMSSWIASPIGLAAKYSVYSTEKVQIALGTIIASSGYLYNAEGYGGLHWATLSLGDRKANLSISAGYAYADLGRYEEINSIGDRYQLPFIDYEAEQAVYRTLLGDDFDESDLYVYRDFRPSMVFAVAGIAPVGKKASFIFDAMAFFGTDFDVEYNSTVVVPDVEYYDYQMGIWVTKDINVGVGEAVEIGSRQTIVIMPAMRFHQTHTKAFQVALSGIIIRDGYGELSTVPIPMVSWLRQF